MIEQVDRYAGKATILHRHHKTSVECEYLVERDRVWIGQSETAPGLTYWTGKFTITGGDPIGFQSAVLGLPDGRSGEIFITHLSVADITPLGAAYREVIEAAEGRFVGNGAHP